ncbi:DUF4169 family protein [Swingsia samuiensis]|uniref:DUF4169 family protein n=1 Tax=Swingsia samuiensis TaxID=1293412 RepID=A0A4Y6UNE9_9PROT|nr:DUF4169 family protein [Swingsia samuiensis]QDH17585.1 DUF4169 family protein [Swingsia samuiensis]
MTDVINLRRERKRRKSLEDAKQAETNRLLYGRTKAQKQSDSLEKLRKKALLDGKRLREED